MSEPVWEVFRKEKRGAAFEHAGSVVAPDADFAEAWAREQYGRRGESVALWLVPRDAIRDVEDWAELRHVVTGHGPKTADRLDLRRAAREQSAWVRSVVLAEAA